jgi:predicted aspartyl protease
LDTGASVSVLPKSAVESLGLDPKGEGRFRGYDGFWSTRSLYYISIEVEGLRLSSIRVTASERPDMLLGRDVLNHFILTLDGKALTFEMVDP